MATSQPSFEAPSYTQTVHRSSYPAIDPAKPSNSAAGKVIVITGGGIGIGKAIAQAFVTAGAKAIAILGRRANILAETKKELEAAGSTKIITHTADVLDEAGLGKAFAAIAQEAGPIDVVVGNVGYLSTPENAATADLEEYFRGHDVNVRGTLLTFRAFFPHKSANSVFLSLNSGIAHARVIPGFSAYAASKAAQAVLISHLQAEHSDIRFVSFHPGVLETDMLQKSGLDSMTRDHISLPASFAVWLASPAADWTGGRYLWSHWDVDELAQLKDQVVKNDELRLNLYGWPRVAEPSLV